MDQMQQNMPKFDKTQPWPSVTVRVIYKYYGLYYLNQYVTSLIIDSPVKKSFIILILLLIHVPKPQLRSTNRHRQWK